MKGLLDKTSAPVNAEHNFLRSDKLRYHYKYLNLELSSNVEIELVDQIPNSSSYDVTFDILDNISDTYKYPKKTLILESNKQKVVIYKKDIGIFFLENGKKITLHPFCDYDSLVLSNTILNLVYGFLLYQRGRNVLHTSAIELDKKAILFVGPSGSGKSSMASLFSKIGGFITEDLGVLAKKNNKIFIQKTLPFIKLENSHNKKIGYLPGDSRGRSLYFCSNPAKNDLIEISNIYLMQWSDKFRLGPPSIEELLYNFQISTFSAFPFNSCHDSSSQALKLISDLEKNIKISICSRSESTKIKDTYDAIFKDLK